jgi:hypothetical protein
MQKVIQSLLEPRRSRGYKVDRVHVATASATALAADQRLQLAVEGRALTRTCPPGVTATEQPFAFPLLPFERGGAIRGGQPRPRWWLRRRWGRTRLRRRACPRGVSPRSAPPASSSASASSTGPYYAFCSPKSARRPAAFACLPQSSRAAMLVGFKVGEWW